MNYYQSRGLSFLGLRAIDVSIECAQSRRLPYLQIIGASSAAAAEQRERVMAAIEASGFKLPGRRLTVRYQPDLHGIPLENFDCALALAILGTTKAFPTPKLPPFIAFGALSLNGILCGEGDPALLHAWLIENPHENIYVPWDWSTHLGAKGAGGGFRDLQSLVQHLREGGGAGPRKELGPPVVMPSGPRSAMPALSRPELRLCEISAAGGHHLLVVDGEEGQGARLSQGVRALLPPRDAGGGRPEEPPLRPMREAQAGRFFRFDRKHGTWGELSLAHGGVLHLQDFQNVHGALGTLWEAMRDGSLRYTLGTRVCDSPTAINVVAETAACECGGSARLKKTCVCRPALKERRLRAFSTAPFDLRGFIPPSAEAGVNPPNLVLVTRARGLMLRRAGKLNGRLLLSEALAAKKWSPEAREWLRVGDRKLATTEALARTALTVSDLREGGEVSRNDLLEAWHHVAGLEFLEPVRSVSVPRPRRGEELLN